MGVKLVNPAAITVTTAGTRVQLSATSITTTEITITGDTANSGTIYVGDSNVSSTRYMYALAAGETVAIMAPSIRGNQEDYDLSDFWVDASENTQKAQIAYVGRR
jgi:hypothetical protein